MTGDDRVPVNVNWLLEETPVPALIGALLGVLEWYLAINSTQLIASIAIFVSMLVVLSTFIKYTFNFWALVGSISWIVLSTGLAFYDSVLGLVYIISILVYISTSITLSK